MKPITICALSFGDHLDLIQRTLWSISKAIPRDVQMVEEFRIGLNDVSRRVLNFVGNWAREEAAKGIPVHMYLTDQNRFKYPVMRKMLRKPRPVDTPYVMWFDDDSFFEDPLPKDWWIRMLTAAAGADMLGQIWTMPVQGNQLEWIRSQWWSNPQVPSVPPKKAHGKPAFEFCQGAWWVARTSVLLDYDWPATEIRHNGGDSMLGELMRQQDLRMVRFISGSNDKHDGVRINADGHGRHSKHPRRGHDENRVGWDYNGIPLDTSHQDFTCEILTRLPPEPETPEIINLFQ